MVKIRKFNKIIFFSLTLIASTFSLISCNNNVSNNENKNKDILDNKIEILKNKANLDDKIYYFDKNLLHFGIEDWTPYLKMFNLKTYWISDYTDKIFDRGYLTLEEMNFVMQEEEKKSNLKIPFSYNKVVFVKNSQDIKNLEKSKILPAFNKYISDTFGQQNIDEVLSNNEIYILKYYTKIVFEESRFDPGYTDLRLTPFFGLINKTKKWYIIDSEVKNGKHIGREDNDAIGREGHTILIFSIPKDKNITLFSSYDIVDILEDITK
ncbi:hypothetical protein [Mycoplasma sp. 1654_15]|uniref:hypothetical protein n=1 Tax=Mycoplasma sp. 1654_15 TaxID=2725994 RepID=UPI001597D6CE|nr:hypothetical protein [Mycoplasma sp. 1654_15]QKG28161.1 hypothetical protein HF996_00760 [Mycoplasma sp. 1654_15]